MKTPPSGHGWLKYCWINVDMLIYGLVTPSTLYHCWFNVDTSTVGWQHYIIVDSTLTHQQLVDNIISSLIQHWYINSWITTLFQQWINGDKKAILVGFSQSILAFMTKILISKNKRIILSQNIWWNKMNIIFGLLVKNDP